MKQRISSLLLILMVSVGFIRANVVTGTCGQNLTWDLTDSTLTISGTGVMIDYDSWYGVPWYSYSTSITSVVINEGVTSIGSSAFSSCTGLTSVTIPNSVTSIGNYAFSGNSLTSVTIPNSVTSIGDYAFMGCSSLTSVTIGNSVTSIGSSAFSDCRGLTSVTIPNSVTSIGEYAFYNVPNIVYSGTATGSPWGARSVNGYVEGWVVYADASKTSLLACSTAAQGAIVIPNSVTSIGDNAFWGCSGLTSVTIPNSVTSIGEWAFYWCTGLTSMTISNSVTSIGNYAFQDCTSLTSVTIPNSVTSIGDQAFYNCSSLTSVTIPNSVTSIGSSAFSHVPNIVYSGTATGSPWGAKTINGYIDGDLIFRDDSKTVLTACITTSSTITIPESVTSIASLAFENCSTLTNITIPVDVSYIDMNAFSGCTSITTVIWNARNCYIYSYNSESAFADSRDTLSSLVFGNEVKKIPYHLCNGLLKLTTLTIPASVQELGNYPFRDCYSLEAINVENANSYFCSIDGVLFSKDLSVLYCCPQAKQVGDYLIPNTVTRLDDYAFYNCGTMTSIVIPESVTEIGRNPFTHCNQLPVIDNLRYADTYLVGTTATLDTYTIQEGTKWIGDNAFFYNMSLLSIDIPNSVTVIGESAFEYCTSITSITMHEGLETISDEAFYKCSSLVSLTLPNSVTSIGNRALSYCEALETISMGENIKSIGGFNYCNNLKTIRINTITPPSLGYSYGISPSNIRVIVPSSAYYAYKAVDTWSDYNVSRVVDVIVDTNLTSPTSQILTITDDFNEDKVVSVGVVDNFEVSGKTIEYIGLEPSTPYLDITIFYRTISGEYDTLHCSFTTTALELTTKQPKAVSSSTALLFAETNMSDVETSCGFEYKRDNAPDAMEGTKVYCPVASGQMTGRLKNLRDDTYYKYRAFYQSAAGNMYYGDWQYIFTGDATVEFDPVLYTYTATVVKETEATISGYALAGAADFTEQGFEYWAESRVNNSANAPRRMSAGLNEHFFVPANGIKMTVTLTDLDEGTVYKYRAYGKVGNQYYYGSEQTFTTAGEYQDVTAIEDILSNPQVSKANKVLRDGHLYILRDGKAYTVMGQEVR